MRRLISLLSLSKRTTPSLVIFRQNRRYIFDRSFRTANVCDLQVAQQHSTNTANQQHFQSFQQTSTLYDRDLSKQIIIDLSHEQGYKRGHITGALNLPLEKFDFCKKINIYGGIMQDEVYSTFKALGVSNETSEIILYDNSGLLSCRLWFVLRYFGFTNIRILNGGWRSWMRCRLPVDEKEVLPPKENTKEFDLKPKRKELVTMPSQMLFDHEQKSSIYIDTRKAEAYKSYHIPRAINIPPRLFMEDGQFLSVHEIRATMDANGIGRDNNQPIILYSSTSLSACVGYFAMSMAGYDKVSVYDAGISNWMQNFDHSKESS